MQLTRQHITALARLLSQHSGNPHSRSIADIAKALGHRDGNALMGRLKATESQTPRGEAETTPLGVTPATPEKTKGYLYTLTFPFISDDPALADLDLAEIAHEVTVGGSVGGWGEDYQITRTPIDKDTLCALATRFGSTPDFFAALDDDEEDEENEQDNT